MKNLLFVLCLFLTMNSSVISDLENTLNNKERKLVDDDNQRIKRSTLCDLSLIKAYGL